MKELQAKYKNDKEKLNQEMMALWREHGANPLSGCLPILVQIPIFFALFRVLNSIKPEKNLPAGIDCTKVTNFPTCFNGHYGISETTVGHFANAKIFGVPIAAAFDSSKEALHLLAANAGSTKVLAGIMVVLMAATTFWTQRQMLARSKAQGQVNDQMAQTQKILLYVLPLTFFIFGYRFPIGVLLYWLTTNLWSMGQQHIVIARMDSAAGTPAVATANGGPSGPAPGAKPFRPSMPPSPSTSPGASPGGAGAPRPGGSNRRPAGRNRRKRRGGRR
jgi:YidC/Oxa1 family membrane protein insertase